MSRPDRDDDDAPADREPIELASVPRGRDERVVFTSHRYKGKPFVKVRLLRRDWDCGPPPTIRDREHAAYERALAKHREIVAAENGVEPAPLSPEAGGPTWPSLTNPGPKGCRAPNRQRDLAKRREAAGDGPMAPVYKLPPRDRAGARSADPSPCHAAAGFDETLGDA